MQNENFLIVIHSSSILSIFSQAAAVGGGVAPRQMVRMPSFGGEGRRRFATKPAARESASNRLHGAMPNPARTIQCRDGKSSAECAAFRVVLQ
jgi:hypothetical protein